MKIEVFCGACKEYILDTNPEVLELPLAGHMFSVREGREWDMFHPSVTGLELICPMCSWTFHVEEKLIVGSPNRQPQAVNDIIDNLPEILPDPPQSKTKVGRPKGSKSRKIEDTVLHKMGIPVKR